MLVQTSLVHTAQVRGRRIAWDGREVVQHGLLSDYIALDLDAEWRECDRIQAVLAGAGEPVRILVEGGGFNLPSSLMERTGAIRMCLIGYVGESARIVTAKEAKPLTVVESGEMGGTDPAPEQPDLWARLMEEVRKATEGAKTAAQSATRAEADLRAAADAGDFDGEDGKTPVRGVDYWTAEDRKPIEDATLAATTAAGRADAAAEKASVGEASRVAAEAERANAETARAKAEQARAIAETGRVEAEKVRVTADAERGERVDASVQKAVAASARAAEAAGKAETAATEADAAAERADAAAKGASENILVGMETATVVHVDDAWPAPLRECRVLGKSEQDGSPTPDAPKPIVSVTKAELHVRGRNLVDVHDVQSPVYNFGITDQEILDEFNRLPRDTPLVFSCKIEPSGGNTGEINLLSGADSLGILRNNGVPLTIKRGEITQVNFIGGASESGGRTFKQVQVAAAESDYAPPVNLVTTAIDLQGHELRGLPNGVRDEVVVDREGNVSLIVRTKKAVWNCDAIISGTGRNYAICRFPDIGANYSPLLAERAVSGIGAGIGICYVNAKMIYVTVPSDVTTPEQANELYGGMQVVYQLASPQTIPLGKVEVPALPESTSNVWNGGGGEVSATYVRDVNIAFSNLESKLTQAVVAAAANL